MKTCIWRNVYEGTSMLALNGEVILSITRKWDADRGRFFWYVRMAGESEFGKPYKTMTGAKRYAMQFAEDVPFTREYHVVIKTDLDPELLAKAINRSGSYEMTEAMEFVDLEGTTFKKMEVVWKA